MLVLAADDDPTTCALVATILRKAGHDVVTARDAMQVMWMVKQHKPDLIVLDLHMPAGNGVSALQRLRASLQTNRIPVVVLSGTTDQEMIDRVHQLGVIDFLHKPVDPTSLLAAIERANALH